MATAEIQLGKNGVTENFIYTLKNYFKKHDHVRVSVLKAAGHDKEKIKDYSDKILEKIGKKYTTRLIGFKIIIKKWRKER